MTPTGTVGTGIQPTDSSFYGVMVIWVQGIEESSLVVVFGESGINFQTGLDSIGVLLVAV